MSGIGTTHQRKSLIGSLADRLPTIVLDGLLAGLIGGFPGREKNVGMEKVHPPFLTVTTCNIVRHLSRPLPARPLHARPLPATRPCPAALAQRPRRFVSNAAARCVPRLGQPDDTVDPTEAVKMLNAPPMPCLCSFPSPKLGGAATMDPL